MMRPARLKKEHLFVAALIEFVARFAVAARDVAFHFRKRPLLGDAARFVHRLRFALKALEPRLEATRERVDFFLTALPLGVQAVARLLRHFRVAKDALHVDDADLQNRHDFARAGRGRRGASGRKCGRGAEERGGRQSGQGKKRCGKNLRHVGALRTKGRRREDAGEVRGGSQCDIEAPRRLLRWEIGRTRVRPISGFVSGSWS